VKPKPFIKGFHMEQVQEENGELDNPGSEKWPLEWR